MSDTSAPEAPEDPPLAAPADPALAGALDAFRRGDYRAAAEQAPATVDDAADDRIHLSRLERALAWEPTLWIAAAVCGAVWLWAFAAAQSS